MGQETITREEVIQEMVKRLRERVTDMEPSENPVIRDMAQLLILTQGKLGPCDHWKGKRIVN